MMLSRTWQQKALRAVLFVGVLSYPLWGGPISFSLFAVASGVMLAYDGLQEHSIFWCVTLFFITEILLGFGLGTLSIAYLLTVAVLRMGEGFVGVTPLVHESGWNSISIIRSVVLASILTAVMMGWSILVQAIGYRQGTIGGLFAGAFHPVAGILAGIGVTACIGLIVLHRIDVPFRRQITFGR